MPASPEPAPLTRRVLSLAAIAIGIVILYDALIVTNGLLEFVGREPGWKIFRGMWQSLSHGRFDIPPADITNEAYRRDGRTYSYFGIFPALVRGVASIFRDLDRGGVPQLSCTLAAAIPFAAYLLVGLHLRLHQGSRRVLFGLQLAVVAFASPIVASLSLASVYNEAQLWGIAWACTFHALLVLLVQSPSGSRAARRALTGMALAAGLALISRSFIGIVLGLELLATLGWLWVESRKAAPRRVDGRGVARAVSLWLVFCCLQGLVNYERWGNPFDFLGTKFYGALNGTERGRKGKLYGEFRMSRLPVSACYYFVPGPDNFRSQWPFIASGGTGCFPADFPTQNISARVLGESLPEGISAYYDFVEGPVVALPLFSPALMLFALLGALRLRRANPALRMGGLIALSGVFWVSVVLLRIDVLALRYHGDWMGGLTGLGFIAVQPRDEVGPVSGRQRWETALLALVVGVSVFTAHITMLLDKATQLGVPNGPRKAAQRALNGEWPGEMTQTVPPNNQ